MLAFAAGQQDHRQFGGVGILVRPSLSPFRHIIFHPLHPVRISSLNLWMRRDCVWWSHWLAAAQRVTITTQLNPCGAIILVALDEQFHHKGAKARSRRHCGSEAAQSEKSLARRIIDVASPRRRDTSISSPNSCVKFSNQQSVSNSFASFCRCGENRFRFIDHRPLIFKRSADAYGNTLIFTGPGPDGLWFTDDDVQSDYGANEIIYCGYRFDPESQLYYVRNRTYNPVLGRWIQRDPIGYSGGINLYGYGESSPAGNVDAMGAVVSGVAHDSLTLGDEKWVFGPPVYDIGWIQKVPGETMLNLVANPSPPPVLFQGSYARHLKHRPMYVPTLGAWESSKEYRDVLYVQLTVVCCKNKVVRAIPSESQYVGYTPLPFGRFLQGEGSLKRGRVCVATDKKSVSVSPVAKFHVAPIENAGYALTHWGQLLPWAWARISYTLGCDGKYSVTFHGSWVPSADIYVSGHKVAGYSMLGHRAGITQFLQAGYGNMAPGY